jgi:hypothetical protein
MRVYLNVFISSLKRDFMDELEKVGQKERQRKFGMGSSLNDVTHIKFPGHGITNLCSVTKNISPYLGRDDLLMTYKHFTVYYIVKNYSEVMHILD